MYIKGAAAFAKKNARMVFCFCSKVMLCGVVSVILSPFNFFLKYGMLICIEKGGIIG
jgi:hypothetical protein